MAKSGRIGGTDRGSGRGRRVIGGIGLERNTRIEESAPGAMSGEERMIGRGAGCGSAVSLLDYIDGEGIQEIETMIIDDEGMEFAVVYEHRSLVGVRLRGGVLLMYEDRG